jgi:tetratricopeptide (TPR) repeat protein
MVRSPDGEVLARLGLVLFGLLPLVGLEIGLRLYWTPEAAITAPGSAPTAIQTSGGLMARLRSLRLYQALAQVLPAIGPDQRALDAGFTGADFLGRYAALLMDLGAAAEAHAIVDRGLAIHPGACELEALKGLLLEEAGNAEDALEYYSDVLGRAPDCQPVWQNLGALRMHRGEWAAAVETLKKALLISGRSYPIHHLNLGLSYLGLGDGAAALGEFRLYCETDPACAEKIPDEYRSRLQPARKAAGE